jgi:hypothetical protein
MVPCNKMERTAYDLAFPGLPRQRLPHIVTATPSGTPLQSIAWIQLKHLDPTVWLNSDYILLTIAPLTRPRMAVRSITIALSAARFSRIVIRLPVTLLVLNNLSLMY